MRPPDWKDLERLWQSSASVSVNDIVARQYRRRWLSRVNLFAEIAISIAGGAISVWAMTLEQPFAVPLGVGGLAFTIFATVASLWARFPRRSAADESVNAAIEVAIDRARASVRWGFAAFWIVAAALVFLAAMALVWGVGLESPPSAVRRFVIVLGAMTAWTAGWQVFSIVYYVRRAAELARLEEIKRSLATE